MATTTTPHSAPRKGRGDELLELASALYARVSSGHDGLSYNVDPKGPALTEVVGGQRRAVERTGAGVEAPPWQRARELREGVEVDRRWNPWVLARHLRGRYSVAPMSAGWVEWCALDIDAHAGAGESPAAARARAERVLGDVWRALACSAERHPLILRSPGGGFHVWFPLTRGAHATNGEHTWPAAAVRAWFEQHLSAAGLELAPGTLEVFPCGRALRAPCGVGMVLLRATRPNTPEALGLVPWEGTTGPTRINWRGHGRAVALSTPTRRVGPMVTAFLAQWDAQRRTLADWLLRREASWDPRWGFLGWRTPPAIVPARAAAPKKSGVDAAGDADQSQESDDVLGRPGGRGQRATRGGGAGRGRGRSGSGKPDPLHASPPERDDSPVAPLSGPLVRGRVFKAKVQALLANGITAPSSRHDAVLVLCFYWGATCGLAAAQVLARVEAWCRAHPHAGSSLAARPRAFLAACRREAAHYLEHHGPRWLFRGAGDGGGLGTLTPADHAVIAAVDPRVRAEVTAILSWLAGRADAGGVVGEAVQIASGLLARLCGDRRVVDPDGRRRRAVTRALEELERLGVLTLAANYVVGRRGRTWHCWYRFGSGELARTIEVTAPAWQAAAPIVGVARPVDERHQDPAPADVSARCEPLQEAPDAAPVTARVIAERQGPEGVVRVLSDGRRTLPRVLFAAAAARVPAARAAWYQRCYARRRFAPGTLAAGDLSPVPDVAARRRLCRRLRIELGTAGLRTPPAELTAGLLRTPPAVARSGLGVPDSERVPLEIAAVAAHAWRGAIAIAAA